MSKCSRTRLLSASTPRLSGSYRGCRSHADQDQEPTNQRICERFHRTVLDEFYRVAFRKKIYRTIDQLQSDLDVIVQRNASTSGTMVLWQNADADLP